MLPTYPGFRIGGNFFRCVDPALPPLSCAVCHRRKPKKLTRSPLKERERCPSLVPCPLPLLRDVPDMI